jgi:hypothetical protein
MNETACEVCIAQRLPCPGAENRPLRTRLNLDAFIGVVPVMRAAAEGDRAGLCWHIPRCH